ncbi:MAG: hypothetical protein LBT71_04075 [Azoarcus sp.]|nr:hypothetical protein [Azoarcus sp.]
MKSLREFTEKWHPYPLPTVMDFEQEISVIQDVMTLPDEEIKNNRELFCEIIKDIERSHGDNGIFELTKENEYIFFNFAEWLSTMGKKLNTYFGIDIDTFRITFDEIQEEFSKYKPQV